ncbi:unnamed protein product [Amoebophrya sp. A120]|nr:unnamed protein product [Amoebophrya sp. A120]|eukprot:GSA120T00006077001.1
MSEEAAAAPAPEEGAPAEGADAGAEQPGEEAAQEVGLTEVEIMEKMGQLPLDEDMPGMKAFFMNTENYMKYKVVVQQEKSKEIFFSGKNAMPYVFINKQEQLDDIARVGFYSDFHAHEKDLMKYTLEFMLLVRDSKRVFGDNFVWCQTVPAYEAMVAVIEEKKEAIQAEYLASLSGAGGAGDAVEGGAGGDGAASGPAYVFKEDETVFVKDEPITPRNYVSETTQTTVEEVDGMTVKNTRPLLKVMIARQRSFFGEAKKYNDNAESSVQHKPQKDPNFNLLRRELDKGVQAVPVVSEGNCQTHAGRPKNANTQYAADDFGEKEDVAVTQVESLTEFLRRVFERVDMALQQNETVDLFAEEFAGMGDDDGMGPLGGKASSNIKELRNFHDVAFTKDKRIQATKWVPGSSELLAVSCVDTSSDKTLAATKAATSYVLLWSFADALAPHASLLSPYDVSCLQFYPGDRHYLIGGLANGQLIMWKFSPADLGATKNVSSKVEDDSGGQNLVPQITHKTLSIIDDSHKKPVSSMCWLPPKITIEGKKAKTGDKGPEDGPIRYLCTIAGDGQFLIWDFAAAKQAFEENETDFQWKPVHRVQLSRQDSGTEMGCCEVMYCDQPVGDPSIGNFYASTEEGELIYADWTARGEEDRKPEYVKKLVSVSKTFRPMLSLERSPIFPNMLLGVCDWSFYIWNDTLTVFASPSPSAYFTCGCWSPTRSSVVYLGRMDGFVEVWDFSDQSHKASLAFSVSSSAISSMCFHPEAETKDMLAVGDADGHLHVMQLPKNLVRSSSKEVEMMEQFLQREEAAVVYFDKRKQVLGDLAEELQKQEGVVQEEEAATKSHEEILALKIEAMQAKYRSFETEMKIQIAEEAEAAEKAKSPKGKK